MESARDGPQWRAFVLAVLNIRLLLPENLLISELDLRETGCNNGRWIELAHDHAQLQVLVLPVLNLLVLLPES
jgi:hypothetical protein